MSLLQSLTKITARSKKRLGRGYGSGKGGHTSSRGQKGQTSRVGSKIPLWFEGGQLPGVKKYPMIRGKGRFSVLNPTAEINLTDLEKMPVTEITLETLKLHKVIEKGFKKAKIVNSGTLTKKLSVKGVKASAQAVEAIQKLGGSVE
ncbi:MAG: 50S ribosomal protein L15 [Candidatus Pacebacteria bacterium CG10_big_fil_rev_8_21_14_0_10_36_11]|nr:50S ribosomal protein L15 [Candidatus Pacearchaeota archaeon]OIP73686.1 MAG: 50S ribosomal protein L15 [Candidatus Pacebacteria bacterium CG2_30_36_39]PIR64729.1 MAG: 50S ribosomal protein L15 [Candidatus Pacebacteria bacterium CG10_big_fil_rev_8_21_14_0_10_36_11]PJC42848.1 MAG: 50S ribosomal protein L15 [Candidatus Pacebacteria bacterium CG_4_9_14_0_2_um_filter_36_8]